MRTAWPVHGVAKINASPQLIISAVEGESETVVLLSRPASSQSEKLKRSDPHVNVTFAAGAYTRLSRSVSVNGGVAFFRSQSLLMHVPSQSL